MSENVTVLRDETLGGIEREYREVKRKAAVGERIKWRGVDAVYEVVREPKRSYDDCLRIIVSAFGDLIGTSAHLDRGDLAYTDAYVVLEPTDIVRIDGKRLRMVERMANVGECIIITQDLFGEKLTGVVRTVTENDGNGSVYTGDMWSDGSKFNPYPDQYHVLEPVESDFKTWDKVKRELTSIPTEDIALIEWRADLERKADALAAQVDGLTDTVARLTTAMQRMNIQLRVAREDIVLIEEGVSEDIAELRTKITELKLGSTSLAAESVRKEPLTRDASREAIIERAKRDIEALKCTHYPTEARYYVARNLTWQPECDAEFIVNRDKRTVVCLLRKRSYSGGGDVQSRGIAKCAPDDVFNSHIGRAIALRRALGLAVPDEYINAPAPESVRVGDIVEWTAQRSIKGRVINVDNFVTVDVYGHKWEYRPHALRVIDDSREEVAE
ncbi:hypothetical protein [Paenibacillus abyssi]|uniref:Uncharacterized protein n=1 Tax=Paenibacillus abyssi TaxID=1340531 RepID=A0A917FLL2_9BACL|nr:hypothetical protein [Paenibacillus abyssi]GGF88290.1 hypothetical protein GCM10010916_02020 [Paenibacillus abyssi]